MSKVISIILVGAIILTMTVCHKPRENPINNLVGSPGSCASAVIAGTYTKGVSFNGTQRVTIQIDIEDLTYISLYTDMINGVMFQVPSTSILPTQTGVQNITLGGQGTPINSGTYTFTPTLHRSLQNSDISACIFTITFN
jgi:hypothetical protein